MVSISYLIPSSSVEDIQFPGVARIEERACGNSRGQLKKKWNFQGWGIKKISCGISRSWFFLALEFTKEGVSHDFVEFLLVKSFVISRISKGKVTNLKILGFFFKKLSSNPPGPCAGVFFVFFWISPTSI